MANLQTDGRRARYGAPYISRNFDRDCLDLASQIIKEMPRANTAKRAAELRNRTENKPDLQDAVFAYFMNRAEQRQAYHSDQGHDAPLPPKSPKEQAEMKARTADAAKEIIQRIARVAVLDLLCPNGKPVRENTGTYVEKLGGHLAVIGRAAGKKIVGKALTDAQAAKLIAK